MSDQRLQTLRRRWLESGAPTDEADYLRERVRHGELSPERLALAAYLGHPAALGPHSVPRPYADSKHARWEGEEGLRRQLAKHPKPGLHPGNRENLVRGLSAWGAEALLRAAAAAAWLALPVFEVVLPDQPAGEVLERIQRAACAGYDAERSAVAALDGLYAQLPLEPPEDQTTVEATVFELLGLNYDPPWDDTIPDAARRETPTEWSLPALHAWQALEAAAEATERPEHSLALCEEAAWTACLATSYEATLRRIERDLIPWALGCGDPLRERLDPS